MIETNHTVTVRVFISLFALGRMWNVLQGLSHANKLWHIFQAFPPLLLLQLRLQYRRKKNCVCFLRFHNPRENESLNSCYFPPLVCLHVVFSAVSCAVWPLSRSEVGETVPFSWAALCFCFRAHVAAPALFAAAYPWRCNRLLPEGLVSGMSHKCCWACNT